VDLPKPPILNYEVRKVTPMSRKVLLAATSGAAAVGTIVVAGCMYRAAPAPVPVPAPAPMRVVPLAGVTMAYPTKWSTTQPVSEDTPDAPSPPANPDRH
jgi:hypothetical protein